MRCFVALWPDGPARAGLARESSELAARHPRARRIDPSNLHLTLAFIGELDAEQAARLVERLAGIDLGPPSSWLIDRIGGFAGARVAWAGGGANAHLSSLAAEVRARLDALAIRYDAKPFAAHVTLLRGAGAVAPRAIEPAIAWPIGAPRLVGSLRDDLGRPTYRDWVPRDEPPPAPP